MTLYQDIILLHRPIFINMSFESVIQFSKLYITLFCITNNSAETNTEIWKKNLETLESKVATHILIQ